MGHTDNRVRICQNILAQFQKSPKWWEICTLHRFGRLTLDCFSTLMLLIKNSSKRFWVLTALCNICITFFSGLLFVKNDIKFTVYINISTWIQYYWFSLNAGFSGIGLGPNDLHLGRVHCILLCYLLLLLLSVIDTAVIVVPKIL